MQNLDRQLFLALNFDGGPTWDRVMLTLSGTTMWIPLYVLILWLVWRQAGWRGMVWFLVLMAAGAVNLSDKMTRLNPAGVELARRVVAAESGAPGIPLDLFRSERPSYWFQKLKNGYRVLLINWSEEPALRELDLAPLGITASSAVNFWTDETISLEHNCFRAELAPRSCLLAVFEH